VPCYIVEKRINDIMSFKYCVTCFINKQNHTRKGSQISVMSVQRTDVLIDYFEVTYVNK